MIKTTLYWSGWTAVAAVVVYAVPRLTDWPMWLTPAAVVGLILVPPAVAMALSRRQ